MGTVSGTDADPARKSRVQVSVFGRVPARIIIFGPAGLLPPMPEPARRGAARLAGDRRKPRPALR